MQATSVKQDAQEPEILITVEGRAGVITLNRPKALNAINVTMIQSIKRALEAWEKEASIEFVIIQSNDSRAFCAGGDIRAVYMARIQDDFSFSDAIFREEYTLNHYIAHYPKPYIALIDGICMGGGLGISVHGSHRITTERSVFAMPETAIGFFPDIGASYFLNQCPGEIGTYLGLVGDKIGSAEAIYAGLATHFVPSEKLERLKQSLFKATSKQEALDLLVQMHEKTGFSSLDQQAELINKCFAGKTVAAIMKALEEAQAPEASQWLSLLDKRSPTSLEVTLKVLRRNKGKPLKECLPVEFRLSQRFVRNYDFIEGIRALLVDKDNQPNWQPRLLSQVSAEKVMEYFAELRDKELKL